LTSLFFLPSIHGFEEVTVPNKRRPAVADGPKDVLTAREAAKYLRLTLPTFYRYMWDGKIPSSKIGGRYRFKKSLLDKWLGKKVEGEDVSGRNKFVGKVSAIKRDAILAQVNLEVGEHKITAVITRDALDDLGLKVGDQAVALMKATEVMIIKER
jgi:molybdopterin-binding protein